MNNKYQMRGNEQSDWGEVEITSDYCRQKGSQRSKIQASIWH